MTVLIGLTLLAAAQINPPHPSWMLGTWGWQNRGEHLIDCALDHSATYRRNGRYDFMDETGTWRVQGHRLIEIMTDPGGTGDPALLGKRQVTHFRRIGSRILQVEGKYPGRFIKCPAH